MFTKEDIQIGDKVQYRNTYSGKNYVGIVKKVSNSSIDVTSGKYIWGVKYEDIMLISHSRHVGDLR